MKGDTRGLERQSAAIAKPFFSTFKTFAIFLPWSFNSYDSEGRLMNVTFPTGTVNNLYTDLNSALTVDIESSLTDEEISITTNTSTLQAFYTLTQGEAAPALRDEQLFEVLSFHLRRVWSVPIAADAAERVSSPAADPVQRHVGRFHIHAVSSVDIM